MGQVGLDSVFSQLQGVVSQIAEGDDWNTDLLLVIEYFRLLLKERNAPANSK
jgi:hypothetical protein